MCDVSAASLPNTRFAFFGEFGYGLQCWQPYLKHLKTKEIGPIRTAGPIGSSPFYSFSDDHLELDAPFLDSWGTIRELVAVRDAMPERMIAPSNELPRHLNVCGIEWRHGDIHCDLPNENYSPLELESDNYDRVTPEAYVVVNIKDYYNWGNAAIKNFYGPVDLAEIGRYCLKHDFTLVLNRFPSEPEDSSSYFALDPLQHLKTLGVRTLDMAVLYGKVNNASERNRLQINCLVNAERVFATQGGNAPLSIICNRHVSIIMRGGFDYPDFMFLSKVYSSNVDVAYNARDLHPCRSH